MQRWRLAGRDLIDALDAAVANATEGGGLSKRIVQMFMLVTVLSLAPGIAQMLLQRRRKTISLLLHLRVGQGARLMLESLRPWSAPLPTVSPPRNNLRILPFWLPERAYKNVG